jgi:hypothetical protein
MNIQRQGFEDNAFSSHIIATVRHYQLIKALTRHRHLVAHPIWRHAQSEDISSKTHSIFVFILEFLAKTS